MWANILKICKWIGGVVGGITAVGSIVLVIYTQGIKAEQKRSKDYTFESKVDKLIVNDSVKTEMLYTILNDVGELKAGQSAQVKEQKVMKNIMIQQFSKTMTREEMLDMFGAFEEKSLKKNESYLNEIQLKQDIFWTPLVLK
jgi:hypothetical protein